MGFFKNYFHSSASERKGAIVLLIIILALVFIYIFNANKAVDIRASIQYIPPTDEANTETPSDKQLAHSIFDPNKIDINGWQRFGFTQKQAKSIIKYKKLIGGFNKPEDLLDAYVIDSIIYKKISPFIKISKVSKEKQLFKTENTKLTSNAILLLKSKTPVYNHSEKIKNLYYKKEQELYYYFTYIGLESSSYENLLKGVKSIGYDSALITKIDTTHIYKINKKHYSKNETVENIDINLADTSTLMKVNGIGSVLSNRIIEYRNKLGGFLNKKQILEVYGIEDLLYKQIEAKLVISNAKINKLNINTVSRKTLYNHPYINWNLANAITQYRFQHGEYTSVDKIKAIHLVDANLYLKIAPYLRVK